MPARRDPSNLGGQETRMTRIAKWSSAVTLAAAAVFLSNGAAGQTQICDQRKTVIGHLSEKYREAPVAMGVTNSGEVIEILTADDGDTWTIIVSKPDGMSCLVAAGEGWRAKEFDPAASDPNV
jgi:hypothetical protein